MQKTIYHFILGCGLCLFSLAQANAEPAYLQDLIQKKDGTTAIFPSVFQNWTWNWNNTFENELDNKFNSSYPAFKTKSLRSPDNDEAIANVNAVNSGLAVGSSSISDASATGGKKLYLDVEGPLGAEYYCNQDGENCLSISDLLNGSLWQPNGSNLYSSADTSHKVGIGTATPSVMLDVNGKMLIDGKLTTTGSSGITAANIQNTQLCNDDGTKCVDMLEFYNLTERFFKPSSINDSNHCGVNSLLISNGAGNAWGCISKSRIEKYWTKKYNGDIYYDNKVAIGDDHIDSDLQLDINGKVGASHYCDDNDQHCTPATSLKHLSPSCEDEQILVRGKNEDDAWYCADIIVPDKTEKFFIAKNHHNQWFDIPTAVNQNGKLVHSISRLSFPHTFGNRLKQVSAICKLANGINYKLSMLNNDFNDLLRHNQVSGVSFDDQSIYINLEDNIRVFNTSDGTSLNTVCKKIRITGEYIHDNDYSLPVIALITGKL